MSENTKPQLPQEVINAIREMDGEIPPPNNKMVDLAHLAIARAWATIRQYLLTGSETKQEEE